MSKLFLLRHFKSQWNEENRFTGWTDVPLLPGWEARAKEISGMIFKNNIDAIYSSPLIRNMTSILSLFKYYNEKYPIFIHLDEGKMKNWGKFKEIYKNYIPVYITERLNERYYGKLQGLNKKETMKKYGKERVHLWRRSFLEKPPAGENLKMTVQRAAPVFKNYIDKDLKKEKNVLVVASHNSLRALIKHIEKIPDKDIINVEVDYGGLIKYDFDKKLNLKKKKVVAIAKK
jgi:2,3-bisphosphoglycerate-dependent phosphoglycerate mutase